IGLPFGSLHCLTYKESEKGFLTRAIVGELFGIGGNHLIDNAVDFASVAHLNQSLVSNNRLSALPGLKHFDKDILALFAADLSFINHAHQRPQLSSANGRINGG